MAILPDPEIAAHLGEVQWFLGERQAALQTWQRGLAQSPNHPTIKSTMQRLGVDAADFDTTKKNGSADSAALIDTSQPETNQ